MSSNEIKYEVTPKHEGGQISEGTLDNDVTQNLKLRFVCPRFRTMHHKSRIATALRFKSGLSNNLPVLRKCDAVKSTHIERCVATRFQQCCHKIVHPAFERC